MLEISQEERKQAQELLSYIQQSACLVVESRLATDIGEENAARIIKQIKTMAEEGLDEEAMQKRLALDNAFKRGRAAAPLIVVVILAMSQSSCV